MKRFLIDLLVDFLTLVVFFATICGGVALARAEPCEKWVEVSDGVSVQENEPVRCDGIQGPLDQFGDLMKCVKSDLPACETKRGSEAKKAEKIETALRRDIKIEKKRGDRHVAENAKMRTRLEDIATVDFYEHPAFWVGVGAASVAILWVIVEVAR